MDETVTVSDEWDSAVSDRRDAASPANRGLCRLRSAAMLPTDDMTTQRAVVRLVLERERELCGLERLLGSGAVAAVKTLAADGVVVRNGELLWAAPSLSRLEDLGLVASDAS
jgi:hypothetical protein